MSAASVAGIEKNMVDIDIIRESTKATVIRVLKFIFFLSPIVL